MRIWVLPFPKIQAANPLLLFCLRHRLYLRLRLYLRVRLRLRLRLLLLLLFLPPPVHHFFLCVFFSALFLRRLFSLYCFVFSKYVHIFLFLFLISFHFFSFAWLAALLLLLHLLLLHLLPLRLLLFVKFEHGSKVYFRPSRGKRAVDSFYNYHLFLTVPFSSIPCSG